jgi:hypothetical protein
MAAGIDDLADDQSAPRISLGWSWKLQREQRCERRPPCAERHKILQNT